MNPSNRLSVSFSSFLKRNVLNGKHRLASWGPGQQAKNPHCRGPEVGWFLTGLTAESTPGLLQKEANAFRNVQSSNPYNIKFGHLGESNTLVVLSLSLVTRASFAILQTEPNRLRLPCRGFRCTQLRTGGGGGEAHASRVAVCGAVFHPNGRTRRSGVEWSLTLFAPVSPKGFCLHNLSWGLSLRFGCDLDVILAHPCEGL